MNQAEAKKIVVVTGGGQGIGQAIAQRLVENYFVISVDKNPILYQAPNLITWVVDVTFELAVIQMFKTIRATYGVPYALVNNAGISEPAAFCELSLASWERQMAVNLTAPFLMAKEFASQSFETDSVNRKIINIASVSGLVGMPRYAAYNASKAGLIELTKTLAVELAPAIHTCAICPGYILTPMQQTEYTQEELIACAEKNPSKRLGAPEEIAETINFILSGKNNYLNGSILVMDGGETAGGMAS